MSKPVSEQKLLWHLTALDNFKSILKNGLLPRNCIQKFTDIADKEIVQKRIQLGLGSYIPFHFFQGNPFDGGVLKANKDKKFCFIAIYRDLARKKGYKILPKHPLSSEELKLYDYDEGIKAIDWTIVNKRDYSDQECKVACMAECLAPKWVKPNDFFSVTVKTAEDKLIVENLSKDILGNYRYHIDLESGYFMS
jgi:hypothetical protein